MTRDTTARTLCTEALAIADAQPRRAWGLAGQALELARAAHDPESAAIAERARGLAALHLADLDTALRCERAAVRLARRARNPTLAAEARMTLAYVLSCHGQPGRAIGVIDRARAGLDGLQRLRANAQRGAILQQLGRLGEALDAYRDVLPRLRAAGDWVWTWRVLNNRGVLQVFRYHFAEALTDLREAEQLSEREGLGLLAAQVQENLGFAHSRQGAIPGALRHFQEAERRYRVLGVGVSSLLLDRAETLLSVRLAREARATAEQAVEELIRTRGGFKLPEGQLLVATAALLAGDCGTALPAARQAAAAFTRQHRGGWSALARLVGLRCRLGQNLPVAVPEVVRIAAALDAAGWRLPALDARIIAARLALTRGRPAQARALLADGIIPRTGPAELRIRACQAVALRHLIDGRRRAASATITAGLRIAGQYRATLGAPDLLAHVSGQRTELAEMGLRMAVEARSARRVLAWAERGRASHLLLTRASPPADPVLAAGLTEVRAVVAELADARRAGRPVAALERRQTTLENRVRDHLHSRRGDYADEAAPVTVDQLTAALGDAVLLEYVESDNHLYVLLVADGRVRLHPLGPVAAMTGLLEHLPFAMRRAAAGTGRSAEAAGTLLSSLGTKLDNLLTRTVRPDLAGRPLVVVPTGPLQSLPWALLPSCADRPVTVSPSATLWHQAARSQAAQAARSQAARSQAARGAAVASRGAAGAALTGSSQAGGLRSARWLAVAGPDLPGAGAEIEALRRLNPGAGVLTGAAATVGAVLAALPGAGLAHLAAHGTFRRDNPLFSSLRLADGPLTVHDLQTLAGVPEVVILAACDSGLSLVCPGDELLGFSAALLAMGSRALIAAMLPVPDGPSAVLMTTLHRELAAGAPPAVALATARRDLLTGGGPAERVAAAGFVCIGAGLT
ncbi:CHAT domain-containing protein [Winogradskya consettensis]|uniref:CHAT domain-containing protein n=1 Tax=Winogradskya consettensis TaxID=113560 RepID=A0A919SDL0_9ACTN|nr:CHAT domain-containing tetratricopeptide repeat protein [Actinoplanes consettensis]GIM69876.1 CHAT domain-containing protein [Actinoplanes consettensis]